MFGFSQKKLFCTIQTEYLPWIINLYDLNLNLIFPSTRKSLTFEKVSTEIHKCEPHNLCYLYNQLSTYLILFPLKIQKK